MSALTSAPRTSTAAVSVRATWDAAFSRWSAASVAAEASGWDDDLLDASTEAWSALIRTPAPDAAALHWKLVDLYGTSDKDGYGDAIASDLNAAVIADAARLAQMEG